MEIKKCSQCGRMLSTTQFRKRKTSYGVAYRNNCHQCEYANNKFNVLDKERKLRILTPEEQAQYDMLITLFDTYVRMGNKVSCGAYNQKFMNVPESTFEKQLKQATETLKQITPVATKQCVEVSDDIKSLPDFKHWFEATFEDWEFNQIVPSYLRSMLKSLKSTYGSQEEYQPALKALADKIWDYESFLSNLYDDCRPGWLENEELIL